MSSTDNSGFVVIGAGLSRTGTASLKAALEQILEGPTYHMLSVFRSKGNGDTDFWSKAQSRRATADDWRKFIGDRNIKAGVDFPICFYWKELMRIYPEAKVVLSVRSPESWYKSVEETIFNGYKQRLVFPRSWHMKISPTGLKMQIADDISWAIPDGFDTSMFGAVSEGREKAIEFYNKWVEEVKATVPKERLLVLEAKDGWEPLCNFLGVPIPDNPFPNVNDTNVIKQNTLKYRRAAYFTVIGIPFIAVAAIGAVSCYFYWKK